MQSTAQKVAKKSSSTPPKQPCKPHRHSPSYLYLKGSVYYFRHVFNGEIQARFQRREIRIALSTPYLRTAKRIAGKLHVYLEDLLMDDTSKTFPEMRADLAQQLQSLLDTYGAQKPITITTIRKRVNQHAILTHLSP